METVTEIVTTSRNSAQLPATQRYCDRGPSIAQPIEKLSDAAD
jgi:hypothetical protein